MVMVFPSLQTHSSMVFTSQSFVFVICGTPSHASIVNSEDD
jgi:hypothetical protein